MQQFVKFMLLVTFLLFFFVCGVIISFIGGRLCITSNCKRLVVLMRESLDYNTNPCENFYRFVCGNTTEHENMRYVLDDLEEAKLSRLIEYLNRPLKDEDENIISVAKDMYNMCLDLNTIEDRGLIPLLDVLAITGGFPLLDGMTWERQWANWNFKRSEILGFLNGFPGVFSTVKLRKFGQTQDSYLFSWDVPDALRNDNEPNFDSYFDYSVEVFKILSGNNTLSDDQRKEIRDCVDFLIAVMNTTKTEKSCSKRDQYVVKDLYGNDNMFLFVGFVEDVSNKEIDVTQILLTYGVEDVIKLAIDTEEKESTKRTLGNFIAIQRIMYATPFLPKKFRDAYATYINKGKEYNREQLCAKLLHNQMSTLLSADYLQDYYSKKEEDAMTGFQYRDVNKKINRFKQTLESMVMNMKWLDSKNKEKIISKLKNVTFSSPFPSDVTNKLRNVTDLNTYLKTFCFKTHSLLHAHLSINEMVLKMAMASFKSKLFIFTEDHDIFSEKIYYDNERNTVVIPIAFLDYPAFDTIWPNYVTYAGFGSIIARVLTDEVVYVGSHLQGNESELWPKEIMTRFEEEGTCFKNQYNEYLEPMTKNKTLINNMTCVEENVAQSTAIALSYLTYEEYANERSFNERKLIGFEKYTVYQNFFLNYAAFHCKNFDKSYTTNTSKGEAGDPSNEYRVLGSLQNLPEFSEAFGCKEGDPMNPSKKCKTW